MIKLIIGGIGSGKSVYAVKEILSRNNKVFTNFKVKRKNVIRLKVSDIIKTETEPPLTPKSKPKIKTGVNWEFWNSQKYEPFDIIIDEVHNLIHSRRSMTKFSILFSQWLSQVRKMLGNSETNHLYLISQRLNAVDITARELAQEIIYVEKRNLNNTIYIIKYIFRGAYCKDKFECFITGMRCYDQKSYFIANPFFKYYDSYEIIDFGESDYI